MERDYLCEKCRKLIPLERRLALPNTRRCVKCSEERAKTETDVELGTDCADPVDLIHSVEGNE